MALRPNLTFYDAACLQLSRELGVPIIFADRKLCDEGRRITTTIHASTIKID